MRLSKALLMERYSHSRRRNRPFIGETKFGNGIICTLGLMANRTQR